MRKLFYAFGFAGALMFALSQQPAAPNFAGTWTLDKSKSEGLSGSYKIFDRAFWEITQTDKEISIKEWFTGFNVPNLPPARPGRGGGDRPIGSRVYSFGRETVKDMGRSKYVWKATLSNDGNTVELVEKTILQGTDGEVTSTSSDKLSLSADGKVLTVIRHRDARPQDSTLVFNKEQPPPQ